MLRRMVLSSLLLCVVGPTASGQARGKAGASRGRTGIEVAGWRGRTDRSEDRIADVRFVQEGERFRLTSGPHAAVWNPAHRATGDYAVRVRVSKLRSSGSASEESYGLFVAGSDLNGSTRNYLYCVVFGSGKAMVRHRHGNETATLLGKTTFPNVARLGPDGATDEIVMWVRNGRIGCTINGTEVFSAPREAMIGPGKLASTDGVFGLRVSHNLDLVVEGPTLGPP